MLNPAPTNPGQDTCVTFHPRRSAALDFVDCLLAGLAADGGLYLPESWPELHASTIAGMADARPITEVAETVIAPLRGGSIPRANCRP